MATKPEDLPGGAGAGPGEGREPTRRDWLRGASAAALIRITTSLASPSPARAATRSRALGVGYLVSGSDLSGAPPPGPRALVERLRRALESDPLVVEAMTAAGCSSVSARACEDPFDMLQRLGAEEFEVAFANPAIFARGLRSERDGRARFAYVPALQTRRLRGDTTGPQGQGVYRRGIVVAGPSSALRGKRAPTEAEIRAELETERLAVADAYSAAGYIYPWVAVHDAHPGLRPPSPLFCGSTEEAFKHVVSGLAAVGVCEERMMVGPAGDAVREIHRTPLVPTDPVLLRADLAPGGEAADLGREIAEAIRRFFAASPDPIPDLRMERAERRAYEPMVRALDRFDETRGAGRGGGLAGAKL